MKKRKHQRKGRVELRKINKMQKIDRERKMFRFRSESQKNHIDWPKQNQDRFSRFLRKERKTSTEKVGFDAERVIESKRKNDQEA